jgi:hypothetical protein
MDCEYVLIIRVDGRVHKTVPFHSSTLEEAEKTARLHVMVQQNTCVVEFPFLPPIVKGELYRQVMEINGSEFIRTTDGRTYKEVVESTE